MFRLFNFISCLICKKRTFQSKYFRGFGSYLNFYSINIVTIVKFTVGHNPTGVKSSASYLRNVGTVPLLLFSIVITSSHL